VFRFVIRDRARFTEICDPTLMALMNIYSWCIVPYCSFRIWPVFCRRYTAVCVRLILSVGFLRVQGGLREEKEEEVKEATEVLACGGGGGAREAKESLNYKTTDTEDRPKNVRRRRAFLFSSLSVSSSRLSVEFAIHFSDIN